MQETTAPASLGIKGTSHKRLRTQAIRALQGGESFIYAVLTRDGLIKIGYSTDVADRITHLKGGVRQILALKPGTRADEMAVHRSLTGHALEGREWYLPTPSVLRVVNEMRAPLGLEPVVFKRQFAS